MSRACDLCGCRSPDNKEMVIVSRVLKQIVVGLFFLGLIGTVIGLRYLHAPPAHTNVEGAEALQRYGFYLRESSHEAGIDFMHQGPTLDGKLEHIMPLLT